jgi:RNA polymerase sigma factor (sigma-70 family)
VWITATHLVITTAVGKPHSAREAVGEPRLNGYDEHPIMPATQPPFPDAVTSLQLLDRARAGDRDALDQLARRYLPRLRRWARGRLPARARDLADTEDLLQDTMFRALQHVDRFEPKHEGALQAYLRQALINRVRDETRRADRCPEIVAIDIREVAAGQSPLEAAIGAEAIERYESALGRLDQDDRAAVVARLELGESYAEVAVALNKPTANAARMAVSRAMLKLAMEMQRAG